LYICARNPMLAQPIRVMRNDANVLPTGPATGWLVRICPFSNRVSKGEPMFLHRAGAELPLITLTLCLQSAGVAALIAWVRRTLGRGTPKIGTLRSAALVVRLAMAVVVLHTLEILLWAGFYRWSCLSSWDSAVYFSASSYSTLGCNDVVLPSSWRTLAPLESVIGMLMCGISVSLLFAIVTRLIDRETQSSRK
jgi:voltage-gated potassium channel